MLPEGNSWEVSGWIDVLALLSSWLNLIEKVSIFAVWQDYELLKKSQVSLCNLWFFQLCD